MRGIPPKHSPFFPGSKAAWAGLDKRKPTPLERARWQLLKHRWLEKKRAKLH